MYEIEADHRRIEAEPDFPAHERAKVLARQFVESQVALARELLRIALTKTFVALDCASIDEYGVRLGLTPRDARSLVDLGRALDVPTDVGGPPEPGAETSASPTVAQAVLAGEMSVPQATLAGRLLSKPELLREGEDAVVIATSQPARNVHALIREREEEAAQQQPVTPVALAVSLPARDAFARARSVASEQAGTMLTEGETFSVVVSHYLDCFDPLRRGEGARRLPDTSELPGRRTIPAEVRRAVRERSQDRCEVPGCGRDVFLEFAHIRAHRLGGSREAVDLLRLCHGHHVLLDAGRIRFVAWEGRRPSFRDAAGRALSERPDLVSAGSRSDAGVAYSAACAPPEARDGPHPVSDAGAGPTTRSSGDLSTTGWRPPSRPDAGGDQVCERPPPRWVTAGGADGLPQLPVVSRYVTGPPGVAESSRFGADAGRTQARTATCVRAPAQAPNRERALHTIDTSCRGAD